MDHTPSVLVVGRGEPAADAATWLADAGMDTTAVGTVAQARERLDEGAESIDCVVTTSVDADALSLRATVRECDETLPVVLLTCTDDWSVAAQAATDGGTELVHRDWADDPGDLLVESVETAVDTYRRLATVTENELRLSWLVEQSPLGVVEWSLDRTVRRWNEAAVELFGYDAEAAIGRHARTLIPDRAWPVVDAAWQGLLDGEGGTDVVVDVRTAEGKTITCEWHNTPIHDDDGEVTAVLSVVKDVTRRERRETVITRLHEATRDLMSARTQREVGRIGVETARDVLEMPYSTLFLHDAEAGVLRPEINTEESREAFGTPPTFVVGEGVTGSAFDSGAVEALDDGQRDPRAHPDGSDSIRSFIALPLGEYGVLTVSSPVVDTFDDPDVEVARILAANVEAALERAEREQALRERERELERQNDRLDEFASVVSHDLRNPLTVAQGFLAEARKQGDVEGRTAEDLAAVGDALDRMDDLVADLLSLARDGRDVGDPVPVSLADSARTAWATVDTAGATLSVDDDLGTVAGDPNRVRQLFENLFRNSVEHGSTSPDSEDHGDSTGETDPTVTVRVDATEDGFAVADDGPGVPEAERDAVFDSGYTTSQSGTGFGLAIVGRIAEAHGWSVAVEESEAGGARFRFRTG